MNFIVGIGKIEKNTDHKDINAVIATPNVINRAE